MSDVSKTNELIAQAATEMLRARAAEYRKAVQS